MMTVADKGFTVRGVAGVARIEVDDRDTYVETTLILVDGKEISFDFEGLTSFFDGIAKAHSLASVVHRNNGYAE